MTNDDERPSGTGLRGALAKALHFPTDRGNMFGGYDCACGSPWLTDRCADGIEDKWEQFEAVLALLAAHPDAAECDNYRPPLTCLTAPSTETGRCDKCRAHPDAAAGTTVEECTCSITRRIGVEMGRDHDPTCPSAFDEPADPAAGTGLGLSEEGVERIIDDLRLPDEASDIATLLNDHAYVPSGLRGVSRCACGESFGGMPHRWRNHVATVVAARVAEAKAAALREAADELPVNLRMRGREVARWLRDRAARLAPDASPGGEG